MKGTSIWNISIEYISRSIAGIRRYKTLSSSFLIKELGKLRQWSILYGSPATSTDLIALTVQLPAAHCSGQIFSPLDLPTLFLFFYIAPPFSSFFFPSVFTDRIIPQRFIFVFLLDRRIDLSS